nr:hypothetical protein BgiMline_016465 [Biomphalaria glabrata]
MESNDICSVVGSQAVTLFTTLGNICPVYGKSYGSVACLKLESQSGFSSEVTERTTHCISVTILSETFHIKQ